MRMYGLFLLILAISAIPLMAQDGVRDGVFIHIASGSENAHKVLMALSMAEIMATGHDVLVYFDINGIDVVLKDSETLSHAHFTPSKEQLQKLLDAGITIMACPGCLKAAGKTPGDLMEGIKVASKDAFFSFTKGRILSIDY